jgi:hypothetical protein
MQAQNETAGEADLLARTLYLLSRAATLGVCRGRMRAVIQHLETLSAATAAPSAVRQMCLQLLQDWQQAQAEQFGADAALRQSQASRMTH